MKIEVSKIEAIIGAKIEACDAELKVMPFDKYQKGARDILVNVLKAVRYAGHMAQIEESPLGRPEPIDRTDV